MAGLVDVLWIGPQYPPTNGEGCNAQAIVAARTAGGDHNDVLQTARGQSQARWRHALAPILGVWTVWFVSLLSLAPDWTGPLDLTIAGHGMAGERFLYVPALMLWSFAIWWAGRRSERERVACVFALTAGAWALAMAPWSYEWGSGGWLLHQAPVGLLKLLLVVQLGLWAQQARAERIGVWIAGAGATLELIIFIALQSGGWNAACEHGLALTCAEGPLVTAAPAALEMLALAGWTLWLAWMIRRGGR